MNWTRFAVLVVIIALLQTGLLDVIAVTGIKPDMFLILLVFFAIYANSTNAIITSFVIGFAADMAIGTAMGPRIISFCLFGSILAHLHRIIAIRQMHYQALAIFVTGFLAGISIRFLTFLKGQSIPLGPAITLFAIPLYSSLVGPLLFLPCAWWMHIQTHRFSKQQA